MARPNTN